MADYDEAIPPGGVGKITLQVDTTGFQDKITKNALVQTNDPDNPSTEIFISVTVRPHILVKPGRRIALRGVAGEDIRQVLQIHANDDHPLEILDIETDLQEWLECKLHPKQSGRDYELEVIYRSAAPTSRPGEVRLLTNHPQTKELKLPVFLLVRPDIEVWPKAISFGQVSKGVTKAKGIRRKFAVGSNKGQGFHFKELRYNEDFFKVTIAETTGTPPWRYWLEVKPRLDRLPAGMVRDTVVIKPDVDPPIELKVPISIQVKE